MAKPIAVEFTNGQELYMVTQVGLMRKLVGRKRGLQHAHNYQGDDQWSMDIEAAASEAAVAKVLNLYWSPGGVRATADVGDSVQVRWSNRKNARLILHKEDNATQPFVLVTGRVPHLVVVGWILGSEGQQDRYWTDPGTGRPAYFVPQADLKDMDLLRMNVLRAKLQELNDAASTTTQEAKGRGSTAEAREGSA